MSAKRYSIVKIISETDVTAQFVKHCGQTSNESIFLVKLSYDKYGIIETKSFYFYESELILAKKNGYFDI